MSSGLTGPNKNLDLLLEALVPCIDQLPNLDGKAAGMSLQAFKNTRGQPLKSQEEVKRSCLCNLFSYLQFVDVFLSSKVLLSLCKKLPGWSKRGNRHRFPRVGGGLENSKKAAGAASAAAFLTEAQITLRSGLAGIQLLSADNHAVRAVLVAMAAEVLTWEHLLHDVPGAKRRRCLESTTVDLMLSIYSAEGLREDPVVAQLLQILNGLQLPPSLVVSAANSGSMSSARVLLPPAADVASPVAFL